MINNMVCRLFHHRLLFPKFNKIKEPMIFTVQSFDSTIIYNVQRTMTTDLDYTNYPTLNENDLDEQFVRGSGPGGQSVNKTSNAVVLKHKPTGLIVKCHMHRLVTKNCTEARRLLLQKLDIHLNGEKSIEQQEHLIHIKKLKETIRRRSRLQEMKRKWKEDNEI